MFVLMLLSCDGPPAPDPALCRDYIHRICIPQICAQVVPLFPAGADCESTLQISSGCVSDDFVFTTPSRERLLTCRLAVVRAGTNVETHPSCDDVAEAFDRCPDVVRMIQGIK